MTNQKADWRLPFIFVAIASVEDMGQYLIAQLNDGQYRESQILSPASMAELQRPAVRATSMSPDLAWLVVLCGGVALIRVSLRLTLMCVGSSARVSHAIVGEERGL